MGYPISVYELYFLEFMNNSLKKYKEIKKVWSISGWGHPQLINRKNGASFSTLTSPWGWGTWKDKWEIFYTGKYYEKNLIPNFIFESVLPNTRKHYISAIKTTNE